MHIFIGDISTDRGKAYHALLLSAAVSGKSITYGDNSKTMACNNFPGWSVDAMNPQYLNINTKK